MKTRIQCKNNQYHAIEFDEEWNLVASTCKDAENRATRLRGVLSLGGRRPSNTKGCAALIALLQHGLPQSIKATAFGDDVDFGRWEDIYIRYEDNKLTKARVDQLISEGRAQYPEIGHAERALFSCMYRPDLDTEDLKSLTAFVPESECEAGTVVGFDQYDDWVVPLQSGWMQNVYEKDVATVGGRFVCGIKGKNALVLDRLPDGGFGICEKTIA